MTSSDAVAQRSNSVGSLRRDVEGLPLPTTLRLVDETTNEPGPMLGASLVRNYAYTVTDDQLADQLTAAVQQHGWEDLDPVAIRPRQPSADRVRSERSLQVRPAGSGGDGVILEWDSGTLTLRHQYGWIR